jgi:hypothetical protein
MVEVEVFHSQGIAELIFRIVCFMPCRRTIPNFI